MSSLTCNHQFARCPDKPQATGTNQTGRPTIRTHELRRLLQHWHDLKGDRPLPRRADLDPTDIAYCLGNVALVEIEPPFRPRYRLVGARLADLLGEDPTGRYVGELSPACSRDQVLAAYRRTVETGEPDYTERVRSLLFVKFGGYRLLLPFAWRSEGQTDLVVAAYFPTDEGFRPPFGWLARMEP
jgi:hypothetical protein